MPETIEELKIKLSTMKGEMLVKQQQLDASIAKVAHAEGKTTAAEAKLEGYEKLERESLVTEVHAINPDEKLDGVSMSELKALVKGIKIAHAVKPSTPPTAPPSSTVKNGSVGKSELENAFNA